MARHCAIHKKDDEVRDGYCKFPGCEVSSRILSNKNTIKYNNIRIYVHNRCVCFWVFLKAFFSKLGRFKSVGDTKGDNKGTKGSTNPI